ncbi:hypothetical protein ACFV9W_12475 [Streptomyces sp. NPDC059897]|uniref:hypothetical protein n=1 Tax=Streptomyces sp. NPDC059897 TaxID=3346994 RepID=UPI00364C8AE5
MANQTQALGRGVTTGAESFWYILGCISFGAAYFAKIPSKKALSEVRFADGRPSQAG